MATIGRGFYDQPHTSAVEQVLSDMAEKARLREEQQRVAALQKQRMEHESSLADREIRSRYFSELMRNSGDPRAWELAKSQGLAVPEFRQLPAEQARDAGAQAGIDYYANKDGWAPGFGAANAFQVGTGASIPTPAGSAAVTQDVYSRPNTPQQMVDAADIGGGRKMSAKEADDARLSASRTAAQNTADYARARSYTPAPAPASAPSQPAVGGPEPGIPTGDAYLKTLDPFTANLVKGIADYTIDLTRVSSQRGGTKGADSERNRLAKMVMQYDPTFDMTQFSSRMAARQDFTKGKAAINIRSLNTAIKHIGSLSQAAEDLSNFDTPALNWITNAAQKQAGDKRIVRFNLAANAVESEMASLFKGMGATDQEIKAWREQMSPNMSPDQMKGMIDMAVELLAGRLSALSSQWQSTMGKPRDFTILNEQSRETLRKLKIDPDALDTGISAGGASGPSPTAAPSAPSGGDRQTMPDGSVWELNPATGKYRKVN